MLNSPLLDVAISLVFIFFLLSVLTSGITELILSIYQKRGKDLRWAINEVFNDRQNKNWAELMYDHPLVDGLRKTDDKLPSYISSDVFANALIDIMIAESKEVNVDSTTPGEVKYVEIFPSDNMPNLTKVPLSNKDKSFYNFKEGVKKLKPGDVRTMLNNFLYKSANFDELKQNIQTWYNEYMDRATGWYKKEVKVWLGIYGFCIALIINVDCINVAKHVYRDKSLRDALVAQAEFYVNHSINAQALADLSENKFLDSLQKASVSDSSGNAVNDSSRDRYADSLNIYKKYILQKVHLSRAIFDTIKGLNLPVGWKTFDQLLVLHPELIKVRTPQKCFSSQFSEDLNIKTHEVFTAIKFNFREITLLQILGWLFTAFAISLGAPFWFDTLNKLVNMRNSGKKPSTDVSSK